jgi:UbiD family decarboxylase
MPTDDGAVSAAEITDLRSALDLLRSMPGELVTIDRLVDPYLEIAGIYKLIGAGTPARPPTRRGPAMLLENVKDHDMPVVTGVLASRYRTARLLGSTVERLPWTLLEALEHPIAPVTVAGRDAPCQEVVLRPPFDLRRVLPTLTLTALDAGPYITLGLLRAEDPETGASDVTIHRLCVQGPDLLSVYFVPGRHIDQFRLKAEAATYTAGSRPILIDTGSGRPAASALRRNWSM